MTPTSSDTVSNSSEVNLNTCLFTNVLGSGCGAVVFCDRGHIAALTSCLFSFCACVCGGAVYIDAGGQYKLNGCEFRRGSADDGGAVYINRDNDETGLFSITQCVFVENIASGAGNDIYQTMAVCLSRVDVRLWLWASRWMGV
jgi:hypothetical protein